MFNTDYTLPTDSASINTNASGDWAYISNLHVDNTSSTAQIRSGETTDLLVGKGYDFSEIPLDAFILGIEVQVSVKTDFIDDKWEHTIQLVNGSTLIGTNKSTGTVINTTWTDMTYGGNNDTWGGALFATDVKSPDFGVGLEYTADNNKLIEVNTIRVKIYYLTGTSPLSLSAF